MCSLILNIMKIGYPCINNSVKCTANSTFRLANYSEKNLREKVKSNLQCLKKILEWNVDNGIFFFRIGSGLVPFASHSICKFNWKEHFKKEFSEIGDFIKKNKTRISMHPDQFVLLNAKDKKIVKNSIKEIEYHCEVLDALGLEKKAKVQIHVGGVYGNKKQAVERFINEYNKLPAKIKKRLCIENDHKLFSLKDCIEIHKKTAIPIIFDVFHHKCLNNRENLKDAIMMAAKTWKPKDGVLMVDYSSQKKGAAKGSHAEHIDEKDFKSFLKAASGIKLDAMLEIKDKEKSCLKALKIYKEALS